MKKDHDTEKKSGWIFRATGALLLLCLLLLGSFTAARYVAGWKSGNQLASADRFYFTSDRLEAGNYPKYSLSVPSSGDAAIEFELRNFADSKRTSETDISYTYRVTVNGVARDSLGGSGGLEAKTGGAGGEKSVAKIKVTGFSAGDFSTGKVTVGVVATAKPYTQTIGAVFELYEPIQNVETSVTDAAGSNTLTMLVTTGEKAGTVTVSWSGTDIMANNADPRLATVAESSCSFQAEADAQYSLVFFKADPQQSYTEKTFTVSAPGAAAASS